MHRQRALLTLTLLLAFLLSPTLFAASGLIVTIAGTGIDGSSGVGGPAVNAQLMAPAGLAVDGADNVYIADSRNNRVVRIDGATGILTLVAGNGAASSTGDGGPAALASINLPFAVALDAGGNLYISEYRGFRIRRVDAQTGLISTVAGAGTPGFGGDGGPATAASLFIPAGIALDAAGNLFIADMGNFRIRRVDAQTGIIGTVAGNGSGASTPDGMPAAGASLAQPMWVAFDNSGGLFIGEFGANRIRRVDPLTGILSTVAGNGSTGYTGDGVAATSAAIGGPVGMQVDAGGNLFFVDGGGRVRRVDAASGLITTVAGNGTGPHGTSTAGGGGGSGTMCRPTVSGDNGPATSATLDGPFAVQLTHSGSLLVSDGFDCRVRRVDLPSPYPYTNTTLTTNATTLQGGQGVLLTATVSPIGAPGVPTGAVQFLDQADSFSPAVLGVAALNGGTASLVVSALSQGGHQVAAIYSGDGSFNSSGSAGVALSVWAAPKATATVSLAANQNPAPAGSTTVFTATVTPPAGATTAPSGPVILYDGATVVAMANLVNGAAQLSVMFITGGNHAMSAVYLGDNNYSQVTSATVNVAAKIPSSVTLISNANPSGPSVAFMATVTPSGATGPVQLMDGATSLGTASLSNGVVYFSISNLTPGAHPIQAVYAGDSSFMGSTSATLTQTVNGASTVLLASSAPAATYGQAVSLTVSVVPASATGTVLITLDGVSYGPAPLTNGAFTVPLPALNAGSHTITASYSGDSANPAGTSAPLTQEVAKATPAITLTSLANPSSLTQTVTFMGSCAPLTPGATVSLLDGETVLATLTTSGSGAFSYLTSTLPAGRHSMTAACGGDANVLPGVSAVLTQTVQSSTTVSLTAPGPFTYGQPVTFTATVSPAAATGIVQFNDGGVTLGSITLAGGQASVTVSSLTAGDHLVVATYQGDGVYIPNNTSLAVQVAKVTTTAAVTSSLNPATVGQLVTLTATVSPAAATGSIQFFDGATLIGQTTLSGGVVTLAKVFSAAGPHSITAVYSADPNYAASTSAALMQDISKIVSNVSLASSQNPSSFEQAVTFTATVAPASATGTVQFLDGATSLGTATVSGGVASLAISSLAAGSHSITAVYSGDANTATSTSAAVSQTVNKAASTVTLGSSANPSGVGQAVTFTATVGPASATGTVQFLDGATSLGTATVSGGAAALAISSLAAGAHSITAVYSGDANTAASTSAAVPQTVNKAASTVTLGSSANPSAIGQSVTFTSTVAPASATGTVQFLDGATSLGTATVSGGVAALAISTLAAGSHSITAVYSGDANTATSTSNAVPQTVNKAASSVTLGSSANPSAVGQSVTVTATVAPASATGTVQFLDGATSLGTATVSGGAAALAISSLAAGSHSITAVYSGDANTATSTSAVLPQTVNKAASTVTLGSSANPSAVGQSVTFTATVAPAFATGTVQFLDGATSLGTATISGGAAALAISSLAAGSHSITAVYSGDANTATSTSNAVPQTVNKAASSVTLGSSANPSAVGQSVTFTATLAPASATGTVQFLDGATSLGTATVSGGVAALAISSLAAGSHSITAVYSGNANYATSVSSALAQVVNVPLPGAPTSLTATAISSSQINLVWTASPTAGVTYNVYASATSGFTPSAANRIVAGVSATSYSQTGLTPATTRYYRVTAQNPAGESAASNQASATTPSGLSCHVGYSITTQWNNGFGTAITIQNTGSAPINSWNLTWTWQAGQKITQSWNSNYTQTGANASLTNASWNGTIAAGATVSGMGFNASYNNANPAPTAFYVNGTLCH